MGCCQRRGTLALWMFNPKVFPRSGLLVFQSCISSCSRVSAGSEGHSFRYFSSGHTPRGTAPYPRKHGQSHGQSSASHDASPTPTPSRPRYKFLGNWQCVG